MDDELWKATVWGDLWHYESVPLSDLGSDIKAITEGNGPVFRVCEMYCTLLTYAQTFERHDTFRDDMARQRSNPGVHLEQPWTGWSAQEPDELYSNPFSEHPVECVLRTAKATSDSNEIGEFQRHRRIILECLEPRYQRILPACNSLWDFITREQVKWRSI
jgi:hypothetical protein